MIHLLVILAQWQIITKGNRFKIASEAIKEKQFSYWDGRRGQIGKEPTLRKGTADYKAWVVCKQIASEMLENNFKPYIFYNVDGIQLHPTFYVTKELWDNPKGKWLTKIIHMAQRKMSYVQVGDHVFYSVN